MNKTKHLIIYSWIFCLFLSNYESYFWYCFIKCVILFKDWMADHSGTMRSISCHVAIYVGCICPWQYAKISDSDCCYNDRLVFQSLPISMFTSPAPVKRRTLKHSRNVSRVVSDTEISIELHGLVGGTELRERKKITSFKGHGINRFHHFLCGCNVREYCPLLTLLPNCRSAVLHLESG